MSAASGVPRATRLQEHTFAPKTWKRARCHSRADRARSSAARDRLQVVVRLAVTQARILSEIHAITLVQLARDQTASKRVGQLGRCREERAWR